MATRTCGTAATTTLTAIPWPNLTSAVAQNDIGAINALILNDVPNLYLTGNLGTAVNQNTTQQAARQNLMPTSLTAGRLFIPNRGWLNVFQGDWIAVDTFGWPILISGRSIGSATTSWAHSGNTM